MAHLFRRTLFATTPLPDPLIPDIFAVYLSRDFLDLAKNHWSYENALVLASFLLANTTDDPMLITLALTHQIEAGAQATVDAILDSSCALSAPLAAILEHWMLPLDYQVKLIDRPLESATAYKICANAEVDPTIRKTVAERFGFEPPKIGPYVSPPATPKPHSTRSAPDSDNLMAVVMPFETYTPLNLISFPGATSTMASYLVAALGPAISEQSKRAWMTFFLLTDDDPDVPLSELVATAVVLSRAGQAST
jgi:hypothetical protein